jgi:uncharacterized protein
MSAPPETKSLPRLINPRKLIAQGVTLSGNVPAAAMLRLQDSVVSVGDNASVELTFSRDLQGRGIVAGQVDLSLQMQCQRCLQPTTVNLHCELELAVVWDEEQAAALPEHLDPWIVTEEDENVHSLIEEELLLALPIVAYHDNGACSGKGRFSTGEFAETGDNPFNVLAQLKGK